MSVAPPKPEVPITGWLGSYQSSWLRTDLLAGATVWAVLIPSALAYAGIVGVDSIVGLYTVPLALLGYALFGGSRLLVVGPDAAISVLAASTIAGVATGDDSRIRTTTSGAARSTSPESSMAFRPRRRCSASSASSPCSGSSGVEGCRRRRMVDAAGQQRRVARYATDRHRRRMGSPRRGLS